MNIKIDFKGFLAIFVAALLAVTGGSAITAVIDDEGVTITTKPTTTAAAAVPNGPGELEEHSKEADETPPEVDPQRVAEGAADTYQAEAKLADDHEKFGPLASAGANGCRTKYNTRNYSSRNGARILLGVAHRTVSRNIPGWNDVYGVAGYLNRAGVQASTHAIVDFEGHCLITVPRGSKAWTQGYFNPWSYAVEMIGMPRDPISKAQFNRTAALFASVKVEPRSARVSGCRVTLSGVIDHNALGCGNNHTDITPYNVKPIIAAITGGGGSSAVRLSKLERKLKSKRCYHRAQHLRGRNRAKNLKWARYFIARIGTQRAKLRKAGLSSKNDRKRRHRHLGAVAKGSVC